MISRCYVISVSFSKFVHRYKDMKGPPGGPKDRWTAGPKTPGARDYGRSGTKDRCKERTTKNKSQRPINNKIPTRTNFYYYYNFQFLFLFSFVSAAASPSWVPKMSGRSRPTSRNPAVTQLLNTHKCIHIVGIVENVSNKTGGRSGVNIMVSRGSMTRGGITERATSSIIDLDTCRTVCSSLTVHAKIYILRTT